MDSNTTHAVNFMEKFFPDSVPLQLTVSSINIPLIAFTILVSLKVDRKDMCRLYTLWLYFAHAPGEIVQFTICILQLEGLVDSTGRYYYGSLNLVPAIGKLFHDISSQVYRVMAMFMVLMTYTSYQYPMKFQKYFGQKKRNRIFSIGFIVICLKSTMANVVSALPAVFPNNPIINFMDSAVFYVFQLFSMAPIVLLMTLYALSIKSIVHHVKANSRSGNSTTVHRRQLLSIIVYATAPNILLLPIIPGNVFNNIASVIPEDDMIHYPYLTATLIVFSEAVRYSSYARIPVITVSTFIAFTPYKQVLFDLLRCGFKKNTVKVISVASVTQGSSSKNGSQSRMLSN